MKRLIGSLLLLACLVLGTRSEAREELRPEIQALVTCLSDADRGVRYAAVIALGKAGVAPQVLAPAKRDAAWCVRVEAGWWEAHLRQSKGEAPRALPWRYTNPRAAPPPRLAEAARQAAITALQNGDRTERIRAALQLAGGGAQAVPALTTALQDPRWRVRMAAMQSLAPMGKGAAGIAPSIATNNLPLAKAARDALIEIGPAAALPTAQAMASGHYGALHWGLEIFEGIEAPGADCVPPLVGMLSSPDVNVREAAARCLFHVGRDGVAARPALLKCLADERLCVVAHAALALGNQADAVALLPTLSSPDARMRAYGAFAIGWALGVVGGIDQVPYEMRLPVQRVAHDVELPTRDAVLAVVAKRKEEGKQPGRDVLLRAIWSPDLATALPAAAALEYDELRAAESERVMELTLPEGLRPDSPVDFDRMRAILGSSEVPAAFSYFVHVDREVKERQSIGGPLHRLAMPWQLPVMAWFERHHGEKRVGGYEEIWFSDGYSGRHARIRARAIVGRDPGATLREIARALWTTDDEYRDLNQVPVLTLWSLRDAHLTSEDQGWLMAIINRALEEDDHGPRLLGFLVDALTRTVTGPGPAADLLRRARSPAEASLAADGGLARAGDRAARSRLVARAATEAASDEWAPMMRLSRVDPDAAATITLGMLVQGDLSKDADAPWSEWSYDSTYAGVRPDWRHFIAHSDLLGTAELSAWAAYQAATQIPLCNTREIWTQILEEIEAEGGYPHVSTDPEDPDMHWEAKELTHCLVVLAELFPKRTRALLHRITAEGSWDQAEHAEYLLLRMGDPELQKQLTRDLALAELEIRDEVDEEIPGWPLRDPVLLGRFAPEASRAWLRRVMLKLASAGDGIDGAVLVGWINGLPLPPELRLAFSEDALWSYFKVEDVIAFVRELVQVPVPESAAWLERWLAKLPASARSTPRAFDLLFAQTQGGSRQSRSELWSILRAARYRTTHNEGLYALDHDPALLPHWINDLESNCCRVSDGLEGVFEYRLRFGQTLYGSEGQGVGNSLRLRMLDWLMLHGGELVWSPVIQRWIVLPE